MNSNIQQVEVSSMQSQRGCKARQQRWSMYQLLSGTGAGVYFCS